MKRRNIIINSVLGLALVGVGATVVTVSTAKTHTAPTGTTVQARRGDVTALVTAAGNVEGATTVDVPMKGSGGTVTKIYVKEGQKVRKGDRLLKVDPTSAKQQLQTARASLASAEGSLKTTTQSRSSQDQQVDNAGVRSAQTSLDNARTAHRQAESRYSLDKKQQDKLVGIADDNVDNAKDQRTNDKQSLSDAKDGLQQAQSSGDTATAATLQTQVTQLQSTVQSDKGTVDSAKTSATQARQSRDKTLQTDRQAIKTQAGAVNSAEDSLSSQKAQRASNQQPAREGSVESAQGQVDSAQVDVDQAEQAVDETTLRAPVDGTVSTVGAVVGESSSSTGGSSSSSSSSGSSGSSSSGNSSGGSGSSSSSSSSSGSSGLVTLVDTAAKQVVATVAEADVTKVKRGQSVSVAFPAGGTTLSGTVDKVATQSTVVDNVVEYDVTIDLPSARSANRLGQTADVTITTATHRNVVYVPTSATTATGGRTVVTRRVNGTDSVVEVQTGLVGSNGTEIVAGLTAGDEIVLPTGDAQSYTFPSAGSR